MEHSWHVFSLYKSSSPNEQFMLCFKKIRQTIEVEFVTNVSQSAANAANVVCWRGYRAWLQILT